MHWAPDASPWSDWAKPVAFAQLDSLMIPSRIGAPYQSELPVFSRDTAVVVDLDGQTSVAAGLALARAGWRPVPLYNATMGGRAVVDMLPVLAGLLHGAEELAALEISPDAPPAFLIDGRRMQGRPSPGMYDNRWVVLPQDFPSATALANRGITRVVLYNSAGTLPREDLRHVLLRWQQAGIELRRGETRGEDARLVVAPPSWFRKAWYRLIALFGLRRSNIGGFGAFVPEATSYSGGYG